MILNKANKFRNFNELRNIFGTARAYHTLTSGTQNLTRIRLNQLTFEAALDKDYSDIAYHFIQSS